MGDLKAGKRFARGYRDGYEASAMGIDTFMDVVRIDWYGQGYRYGVMDASNGNLADPLRRLREHKSNL